MKKSLWMVLLLSCCLAASACDVAEDGYTDDEVTKEDARLLGGRDDNGRDLCQVLDWYGDGICDDFCPEPDPDCGDNNGTNNGDNNGTNNGANNGANNGDNNGDNNGANNGDVACGTRGGVVCPEGQYCHWDIADSCGAADAPGHCQVIPEVCTEEYAPVCGCDGNTYSNDCFANGAGVSVASQGECGVEPPVEVACGARAGDTCDADEYCAYEEGQYCGAADAQSVCRPRPEACDQEYAPVCGCDGETYSNACTANGAGTGVLHSGECGGEPPVEVSCGARAGDTCAADEYCAYQEGQYCGAADAQSVCRPRPEACDQEYAPVCGCDGETYSNACTANGAGTGVLHSGACEVEPPEEIVCGGFLGAGCPEGQFCDYALRDGCGEIADGQGLCRVQPQDCTREYAPVCGCDGVTYSNACTANAQGVSVKQQGACDAEPPVEVACGARAGDTCAADEYCAYEEGQYCGAADAQSVCRPRPEACTQEYAPVCGCDGETYSNACTANGAGTGVLHSGACDSEPGGCLSDEDCGRGEYCDFPEGDACGLFLETPGACQQRPEICTEQYAPVCGCDGVTYDNDCFAAGAGVNVASQGECEVQGRVCGGFLGVTCGRDEFCDYPSEAMCGFADGTGLCHPRPEACPDVYAPVCGCNGVTYGNGCEANGAGVSVLHSGECER